MGDREHLRVIDGGQGEDGLTPYETRTYDEAAEQAVLAYLVQEPTALAEIVFLRPEHFRSEAHRRIYEAMRAIEARGEAIDVVSVPSELRATGRLQQVGMPYFTEILNAVPALGVSHLLTHATRVRNLAVRRELWSLAVQFRVGVEVDTADEATVIGNVTQRLEHLSDELGASEKTGRVAEVAARMMAEIEALGARPGRGGRPSGFPALDATIAGLHDELVVIGARPGMGKTAIACAIAASVASSSGGAYIASLETRQETLMLRMACARAAVEVHRARVGDMTPAEWSRITEATNALSRLPMWIDDTPGMSVLELWAKCRRAHLHLARQKSRLALVVVDYVQLMRAPRLGMKREEVVAENTRALKAMAQELQVTVIGLAQLNREVDKRTDKRPQLSDLRESGELEQCARTVLLLYRGDYYAKKRRDYTPTGRVEVAVAKQNNGPTGIVELAFDELSTRFSDVAGDGLPMNGHSASCRCHECDAPLLPPGRP